MMNDPQNEQQQHEQEQPEPAQQDPSRLGAAALSERRNVTPIVSQPCAWANAATTLESTPPDMATTTLEPGLGSRANAAAKACSKLASLPAVIKFTLVCNPFTLFSAKLTQLLAQAQPDAAV